MKIKFQKLGKKHLKSVVEIEKASFKDPWSKKLFEKEISLQFSSFFVALIGERVAGYGGFWKVCNEADIVNIAVHPDFRRKGVGKKILEYLLKLARKNEINRVFLEVRETNPSAINLYESFGFKTVGRREKYYSGEDALILKKNLNEN